MFFIIMFSRGTNTSTRNLEKNYGDEDEAAEEKKPKVRANATRKKGKRNPAMAAASRYFIATP